MSSKIFKRSMNFLWVDKCTDFCNFSFSEHTKLPNRLIFPFTDTWSVIFCVCSTLAEPEVYTTTIVLVRISVRERILCREKQFGQRFTLAIGHDDFWHNRDIGGFRLTSKTRDPGSIFTICTIHLADISCCSVGLSFGNINSKSPNLSGKDIEISRTYYSIITWHELLRFFSANIYW